MPVPRLELVDVEAVLSREVGPGGRISGLSEFIGCKVLVVVPAETKRKRRKGEGEGGGARGQPG